MNDSNNMYNNNNITSSTSNNNLAGINPIPEPNNLINNASTPIANNTFAANQVTPTIQNGVSQVSQNIMPTQPTSSNITGTNSTPESNNINNNVNATTNNMVGINPVTPPQQINPSVMPMQQPTNNFTQQANTPVPNNNIYQAPINPTASNVNVQPTIQANQNINGNNSSQQNISSINQINDNELLKAYIGKNNEKITTRPFNFAGFFFGPAYMFYRKMFGYALLAYLLELVVLNVIDNIIVTTVFILARGFLVNKIYLSYAKKKIAIIKSTNSQKSPEELKQICSTKGGTSVGAVFLGIFIQLCIAIVVLIIMSLVGITSTISNVIENIFNLNNSTITTPDNNDNNKDNATLEENVSVSGYTCLDSKCIVSIDNSVGATTEYTLNINSDLFTKLGDYEDYIKLDIYYSQGKDKKNIVDYKIFLKSTNEDITDIKTEDELREKIGMYSIGTYTDSFTLVSIGGEESYTYTTYTFVNDKNIQYEMEYINDNGTLDLTEGNEYNITFEVTEDTFGYEYTLKSIN